MLLEGLLAKDPKRRLGTLSKLICSPSTSMKKILKKEAIALRRNFKTKGQISNILLTIFISIVTKK
jgi:hypothetical protein